MKRRAPLDGTGGRATSNTDMQIASRIVDRAGVLAPLSPLMDAAVGRHRISLRGLLVACQLNALARHHRAHLVEVARIINAMTDEQRSSLDIIQHDPAQTYDRVDRLFNKLADVLDAGHLVDGVHVDAKWLANRIAAAAVPKDSEHRAPLPSTGLISRRGALFMVTPPPSTWTGRRPTRS